MSRRDDATHAGEHVPTVPRDSPAAAGLSFVVSPRLVLAVGLPAVALLALASLVGQLLARGRPEPLGGLLYYYVPLTDLDAEGGIPAWYSSLLLVACAAALWTVGVQTHSRWRRHWCLLAAGFVLLSLDEAVSLHEEAGFKLRETFDLGGLLHFSWVLVALPLVVAVAALLVPFLRALPRRTSLAFLVAGSLYVGGAIGTEIVAAAVIADAGKDSTAYLLASTVEEILEMVGVTLFLAAVADHRARHTVLDAPA